MAGLAGGELLFRGGGIVYVDWGSWGTYQGRLFGERLVSIL